VINQKHLRKEVMPMRLLLVIGTRPEAIKMAGIIFFLRTRSDIEWRLCSTGQHRTMLEETLRDLGIVADDNLALMDRVHGLSDFAAAALRGLDNIIEKFEPDWVLVQGDTTTAVAGAMAAFHRKVAVAHVEAGLRTGRRYDPWPEEINRKMIGALANRHFAPTQSARANLLAEGVDDASVIVTGNTVIDALLRMSERAFKDPCLKAELEVEFDWLESEKRMILVTSHRRESFGDGLAQICKALALIAERGDVEIVFPVHLNPRVRDVVRGALGQVRHIKLIEPQAYSRFVYLMNRAYLLLTDSGGIQEEAPSIGKPVLVMRHASERLEAVSAGTSRLVGTDAAHIAAEVAKLLDQPGQYAGMTSTTNPYGDGLAGPRIVRALIDSDA
jgi:UDP-N-acetylglucosamine 2-epimerase (non-hydrolysing)